MVMEEYSEEESPGNLRMALRNPSDALQILERSQDDSPRSSLSLQRSPSKGQSDTTGPGQWSISGPQFTARSVTAMNQEPWSASQPSQFGLNEYELVQRGLLHSSVLPELLQIFATSYHPYCPIVPHYFLGSKAMERIQKEDYFLLTVTLTIASRDSPRHVLIHRYCWDHTQHLLLEVLLAHPWSQTPRTVEGLILLSEWLPHIQTDRETPNIPKSLSSEDRTAWSLIGLAIRLGYLLRLNQAAFRKPVDDESTDREERKRLVWTFVYLVDRQISVRLGHPFWSRGPALSSNFTEKDFPSLKSSPEVNNMNYAFVLEATLELTQIIYNSHQVLYPSTEKTLAMIYDGDYPIYLDDFERSITAWHAKWRDIQAPANVKTTLLLTYEYTRLYVNAFSFQAVVTRESVPRSTSQQEQPSRKQKLAGLFSPGIMSLPDGRYVFEGIQAAKSLLGHMCRFEPRQTRLDRMGCGDTKHLALMDTPGSGLGLVHNLGQFRSLAQATKRFFGNTILDKICCAYLLVVRPEPTRKAVLDQNIVSTLQGGAFLACLVTGFLVEIFGRRWSLISRAVVTLLDVVFQTCSAINGTLAIMYVGRFVSDLDVGSASSLVPLYISECAPRAIRGGLIAKGKPISAFGYVAIVCIYLWVAFYQLGWGLVLFILMSEIPSARLRAINVAIGATTQWLFNFVIPRTVLTMQATMGTAGSGMFLMFGSFCVVMGVFSWIFIPETRGLSLEKMDELFWVTELPSKSADVEVQRTTSQTPNEVRAE
ncbi:hypothetical protein FOVSG1_006644 [Fusarium oxysporum f. sp. vasinfectum]